MTTFRFRLNGYYLTGDLVRRDAQGRYFHLDRAADAVIADDGTPFYTALSEERIQAACPDVADCTVVINKIEGEVVTDVLELDPSYEVDLAELTGRIHAALGPVTAATVRRVTAPDAAELPRGATGKVRKALLRARDGGQ